MIRIGCSIGGLAFGLPSDPLFIDAELSAQQIKLCLGCLLVVGEGRACGL